MVLALCEVFLEVLSKHGPTATAVWTDNLCKVAHLLVLAQLAHLQHRLTAVRVRHIAHGLAVLHLADAVGAVHLQTLHLLLQLRCRGRT